MDFDGDGHLDLVSGSYDPGEIYLFRGRGKGLFAARETINDRSGQPILRVPDQKHPVESFGSWLALVDWDDDGDLDILVGTFDGMMFVRRNEGSRTKPAYATRNEWVNVGGRRLRVPGGAHANPVIADWDGDGRWDIISGSADGGVYWYRNIGSRSSPQFEAPVALLAKHEGMGYSELLDPAEQPRPGIRSQIAVVDCDGDGKLDVLLGDFCTNLHLRKDLTATERQKLQEIGKRQDARADQSRRSMAQLQKRYGELMKGIPKSAWYTDENMAKWQKLYQAEHESAEAKKRDAEYETLQKELQKYTERRRDSKDPDVPHGYVWLFRRSK